MGPTKRKTVALFYPHPKRREIPHSMPNPSGRLGMGHKPPNYYLSVPLVKLSNIANKGRFLDAQRRIQGTYKNFKRVKRFYWLKFLLQDSRVMRGLKVFLISAGIFLRGDFCEVLWGNEV